MKKISKLLIGTNNKGKFKEIKDLLPKYIKTFSTKKFELKSPKEDGRTFEENSIIKSPVIASTKNSLSSFLLTFLNVSIAIFGCEEFLVIITLSFPFTKNIFDNLWS